MQHLTEARLMTLFVDCSDSEFSVVQPAAAPKEEYSLIEDEASLFKEYFASESKCTTLKLSYRGKVLFRVHCRVVSQFTEIR
jgi:hypothetical protein